MLEKWIVVMCTHIREQPSSGGLLLRPSAITSLPLGYVAGKTLHFCHDVDTFFLLLIDLARERGTRADEKSFDRGPSNPL
jgi:hypothetical protein